MNRKAFTIMELLIVCGFGVVLTIIGLLIWVAIHFISKVW